MVFEDVDDYEDSMENCDDYKSSKDLAHPSIKVNTVLEFSDKLVILNFPKCRLERKTNPNPSEYFQPDTFKGRIQKEYNSHPVRQFMGPYTASPADIDPYFLRRQGCRHLSASCVERSTAPCAGVVFTRRGGRPRVATHGTPTTVQCSPPPPPPPSATCRAGGLPN